MGSVGYVFRGVYVQGRPKVKCRTGSEGPHGDKGRLSPFGPSAREHRM